MLKLARSIISTVYLGTRIFYNGMRRSIMEEIEQSRDAARIRYQNHMENSRGNNADNKFNFDLSEAMKILNIDKLDRDAANQKYEVLFQANDRTKGSFYLQSKIVRAHQRVLAEIARTEKRKKLESGPDGSNSEV